jgi:hypothetical protein
MGDVPDCGETATFGSPALAFDLAGAYLIFHAVLVTPRRVHEVL